MISAGALVLAPLTASAQQPPKIPRLGWLSIAALTPEVSHLIDAFCQGLRDHGYAEGRNLAIEYRFAEGQPARLPALAAELVRLKVDIIVTPNPAAAQAAQQATKTIPIVMLYVADPVGSGLVASLAKPGGNITGLAASAGPEITGKLVELLHELVPKVRLVALLRNPANPDAARMSSEAERVARVLGLQVRVADARAPDELDGAFASMIRSRAGALVLIADTMLFLHRGRVAALATRSRVPTISASSEMADAGLLMSYGPNLVREFQRAADYVDRILRGAHPSDLPVEQPTRFDLVVNLRTAKALGLIIPPSLLVRADRVIE